MKIDMVQQLCAHKLYANNPLAALESFVKDLNVRLWMLDYSAVIISKSISTQIVLLIKAIATICIIGICRDVNFLGYV